MKVPPLGPGRGDITWPNQVAPRGRKASNTQNLKPQTSNLILRKGPVDETVGECGYKLDAGEFNNFVVS